MDASTSLLSLPPELITKVCRDPGLNKEDLVALRLTCKAQGVHASATRAYGERKYTEVRLLFSRYSLQSFVDVCKHPVFGACVRKVVLSSFRGSLGGLEAFLDEAAPDLRSDNPLVVKSYATKIRSCIDRYYEENEGRHLLDMAFRTLSELGHDLSLALCWNERGFIGSKEFFVDDSGHSRWLWLPHTKARMNHLIKSAVGQGCTITGLEFDPYSWEQEFNETRDCRNICTNELQNEIPIIGARLQSLEFLINSIYDWKTIASISFVINEATDLKRIRLHLSKKEYLDESAGAIILRSINSCSLQEVDMRGMWDTPEILSRMLAKSKSSIKTLHWSCKRGKALNRWGGLLHWIKNNLIQLQSLRIKQFAGDKHVKLQGDKLRDDLQNILEEDSGSSGEE